MSRNSRSPISCDLLRPSKIFALWRVCAKPSADSVPGWSTPTRPRRGSWVGSRPAWSMSRCVVHTVHGFGFTPLQSPVKRRLFFSRREDRGALDRPFCRGVQGQPRPRGRTRALETRSGVGDPRRRRSRSLPGRQMAAKRAVDWVSPMVSRWSPRSATSNPRKRPSISSRRPPGSPRRCRRFGFVMVGDGPLRGEAEARAAELSGSPIASIFCGWWDDVPGLLAATTVSVLSSRHEGLPCSVVESLAAGVPVVATAVDGTPEVIRPGVNGELVAPGDLRRAGGGGARDSQRRRAASVDGRRGRRWSRRLRS